MGKKSSPPPPPDYGAAAQVQGDANLEAGLQENTLNNPNVNAPGYSVSWQSNPGPDNSGQIRAIQKEIDRLNSQVDTSRNRVDSFMETSKKANPRLKELESQLKSLTRQQKYGRPTQNIELSPEQQAIFDLNNQTQTNLSQIGVDSSNRIGDLLSTPFDSSMLDRDKVAQALIDRDRPFRDQQRSRRDAQLANQGIMLGSTAYSDAQMDMDRADNDFRLGAYDSAGDEMAREFALQSAMRQMPINEINALRSGTQLNMPQYQNTPTNIQPAPMFDATMAGYNSQLGAYNAQQAQQGNLTSGLFGLGGAALMSPWAFQ